ncbi:MAG: phosphate ABC transporter permease subunit PstC [Rhodoluna sp.]
MKKKVAEVELSGRRKLVSGPLSPGDKWFFRSTSIAAYFSFFLVALILAFLFNQALPVLQAQGFGFIVGSEWLPEKEPMVLQLAPMLWGSLVIAFIGVTIATPMSISLAYLIQFMLPKRLAKIATTLVDLLAALPSVILGLWGLIVFTPVAAGWGEILNRYLGFIPIFAVEDTENAFRSSPWIAGWIVAVMIVPIITSVSREIFSQIDRDLINGALALGGSKLSTFRRVILPTASSGVIGGVLLGLGRALGETVAIFYVLNLTMNINWYKLLESEGGAVASWILARFGEASPAEKQGLMAAGLVLFVITLLVNFLANVIVNRAQPWRKNA